MRVTPKQKLQLRVTDAGFVLLFLAVVGLLMWLSQIYHWQFDWTRNGRNTLSEASVAVLERLEGPVSITAFASQRRDLRETLRNLIGRYQRVKPDITLEFVDPDEDPARTREAGIQFDGELLIEYGPRKETVSQHREEQITNALARLSRGRERTAWFLGGHGERDPAGRARPDLGTWTAQLEKRGIRSRRLVLAEEKKIPRDADLLVIASPRGNWLPGEVDQVKAYLERGGNLLWLREPGQGAGLEALAEFLGVEFEPGVIVDPASQQLTRSSATFTLVASYPPHPAVKDFQLATLFPEAGALRVQAPEGWRAETLLETLPTAWAETGKLAGSVAFDPGKDLRGPLTLGVALERERENKLQRVVVIGDGDFLSNSYIGNAGNLDLGMNLLNWLAHDEAYLNIPTRPAPDIALNLSGPWLSAISLGFMIVLPLLLVSTGLVIWLRRRKL